MLALRAVVMARKEPRKLLVQPHLSADAASGEVTLQSFDQSFAGMVASMVRASVATSYVWHAAS
jgi:hypothetical protein